MKKNQLSFSKTMKHFGIHVGGKHHYKFFNYLNQQCNESLQLQYLIFSTGCFDIKYTKFIFESIWEEYIKHQNIITFSELLKINPEWRKYFKENVDENGNPLPHEKRKGVSRNYANDIRIIQKKGYQIKLNQAIRIHMCLILKIKMNQI